MTRRRAAKCFGDSANQYTMINFHLPPIAASAAVNGHPPTALGRTRRVWLPAGTFLIESIGQLIFLPGQGFRLEYCPRAEEVNHDRRSSQLSNQTGPPRGVH